MAVLAKFLAATPRYFALRSSQYWVAEQFRRYTEARLERILAAAARIPFYRERFEGRTRIGDFHRLPILSRAHVRDLNASVRSMYPPGTRLLSDSSSGSIGLPVEFLFDDSHQRGRNAARARYLRANGWNPLRRTVWHYALNREDQPDADFVNSRFLPAVNFQHPSSDLDAQIARLIELDPIYLSIYPSNLEWLLRVIEETCQKLRSLQLIFTGSEVVDDSLRERTRSLLGARIADNYGSTEAFLAWQCPRGSYHVNAEHALIEIVDDAGCPVSPGEMGRVLVTTLENRLMPLVRYEIGDYAIAAEGICGCGRTLPLIGRIAGRAVDLFRMADGRVVSPYDLISLIKWRPEIRQFQIVQQEFSRYRLRYVSDRPVSAETETWIRAKFCESLGAEVVVAFDRVAEIARTPAGKFMPARSELCETTACIRS
jgi:phenylacetate-CoA ligase